MIFYLYLLLKKVGKIENKVYLQRPFRVLYQSRIKHS